VEFEAMHERIRQAPLSNKQARDFLRMFLSGASAEMPDSQNRITIPGHLRQYAGLEKELIVTGVGAHAEIWDAAAWNDYLAAGEENYSELEQEVIPGLF
jgi:MraZ protein